jgi:hypothetical protein
MVTLGWIDKKCKFMDLVLFRIWTFFLYILLAGSSLSIAHVSTLLTAPAHALLHTSVRSGPAEDDRLAISNWILYSTLHRRDILLHRYYVLSPSGGLSANFSPYLSPSLLATRVESIFLVINEVRKPSGFASRAPVMAVKVGLPETMAL